MMIPLSQVQIMSELTPNLLALILIINDEFLEWEERDAAHITLMRHCIAGSIAGISEHLTLYPIDTLKTHL